ncbi:hypothetical protein ALP36_102616 [Pseudomonas syringae pv. coriandricola]|uniref:Uncharacterized protein n=1 Tax=Pseudomonas syringae pv. coriandricola TaxID=264453 RepID=A0A3M5R6Z6_9PSED|nr:hypothetical protein ALP87_102545 [Pseudomonas syringae pv. coriandricola]RMU04710.1 hypothetical protein ALP36_102616 [Pseudomonas syringae pv. coriandricola]
MNVVNAHRLMIDSQKSCTRFFSAFSTDLRMQRRARLLLSSYQKTADRLTERS